MVVSKKTIEENIVLLGLSFDQLKEGTEEYNLVPCEDLEALVMSHRKLIADKQKFFEASQKLSEMINFKEAPMKASMKIMQIMQNPDKFRNELAPILGIFENQEKQIER